MDNKDELEKVGVSKPTYEEIESEYGKMADRCEYAEKLNKSLERIIVEKDNTIESLTREVEDLESIIRSKDNTLSNSVVTIRSLSDENAELKKELAKAKQEQIDIMQDCKFKLNSIYGVNGTLCNGLGDNIKVKLCEEVKSDDNGNTQ